MALSGIMHSDIMWHEQCWVLLNGFLKDAGYELRARYQPDWTPSWIKLKYASPLTSQYEDGQPALVRLMDAIRVHDRSHVMLKMVEADNDPSDLLARFLESEPGISDPHNHCLPLLDILRPSLYPSHVILVYPFCMEWNIWPFSRIGEAIDFFTQIFEGLAFLHKHNIAHLDASSGNILMAGVHLYKEPFHPMRPATVPNGFKTARHLERYQSDSPIKYYYADFETSVRFKSFEAREPILRQLRQDKTVPEEQTPDRKPCDPFALDVYCVGNVIVEHWLKAYRNVEFIRALAMDMTATDPTQRPSADEVLSRFQAIRDSLSAKELDKPLVQIPEYHSALLRGHIWLAERRKRKKARQQAIAAAERAARKLEQAGRHSSILHRLEDLLSNMFVHRDKTFEASSTPSETLRESQA